MKLWIARDKDNSLSISNYKLIYAGLVQGWIPPKEYYNDDYSFHVYIDDKLFPEVTFENSPMEVEFKYERNNRFSKQVSKSYFTSNGRFSNI